MLGNINISNLSPEVLQNLIKLVQTQAQAQGSAQNQNTNQLSQRAQSVPASTLGGIRTSQASQLQQTSNSILTNQANTQRSPAQSTNSSVPKVGGFRSQNQNMRNNMIKQEDVGNTEYAPQFGKPRDAGGERQARFGGGFNRSRNMSQAANTIDEEMDQDSVIVLMVAEKPSIAKAISDALAPGRPRSRKGVSKFCQVHEFSGHMFGKKAFFKVTSVVGHIYVADFEKSYQDWRTVDPYTLFEAPTIKKESNPSSQIIPHLQTEAQDADYLILWLDNDREGENICYEVIDNVKEHMKKDADGHIYRARFSSIVREDLVDAFNKVSKGANYNESRSVDARQIIDLKIGVAFSRFQTRYLLRKYANINTRMVTFGPCQTPTLAFCVERDDEIRNFIPTTFYRVIPSILHGSGLKHDLNWATPDKTFPEEEAIKLKKELEMCKEVMVINVDNKESIRGRPVALNTPEMLKFASSLLGMGPHQAMQVAEKLYQQGFTTYPRTESSCYPAKFDFAGIVQELCNFPPVSDYSQELLNSIHLPKPGKDAGDHPPITPTNKVPYRGNLKDEEWRLYEFICKHFLATISPDAKLANTIVMFQTAQHRFQLKGTRIIDRGFTKIAHWVKLYGTELPEFFIQQKFMLNSVEVKMGKTTAPEHLTESDLISLMEKNGIGTDASMAQHINNICERNYVQVESNNRKLVPTKLGSALVHGYQQIDPELVAPNLRSEIERSVNMIAKGEADYDLVLNEVLSLFSEKFINFRNNISLLDPLFDESFGTFDDALTQGIPFTICGQCQQQMLFVDKFNKLHCSTCNLTLSLPQKGVSTVADDQFCPLDNFQLILFTAADQITSYTICPQCSNRSPFPDITARITCNVCPQADCVYSSVNNELNTCSACNTGLLIINRQVESRLTASCNSCNNKITIAENVAQYQRSTSRCEQCSTYLFEELIIDHQKHENVCVYCHPELSRFIQTIEEVIEPKEQPQERQLRERSQNSEGNRGGFRNNRNRDDNGKFDNYKGGFRGGNRNDNRNFRNNEEGFNGRNRSESGGFNRRGGGGNFGNRGPRNYENSGIHMNSKKIFKSDRPDGMRGPGGQRGPNTSFKKNYRQDNNYGNNSQEFNQNMNQSFQRKFNNGSFSRNHQFQ